MATKVSLGFAELSDTGLDNFAQGVIAALTGNPTYPTPPVTLANLQAAVDDFTTRMAAAQTGGVSETAAKNNSRDVLVGMLRKVATYVQLTCNDDPSLLLTSGFQMQSTNRASAPLEKPHGLNIKNGGSGRLVARVDPVKNANTYEGRTKAANGEWLPSVFSGDSRRITFSGLSPGTNYTIEVRALGGSTGQSDWSDPSTHMAM
jgi:chitodextrinase